MNCEAIFQLAELIRFHINISRWQDQGFYEVWTRHLFAIV